MKIEEINLHLNNLLINLIEANVFPKSVYLAGGTAVYFYLPRRFSIDLDFFSPRPFSAEIMLFKLREIVQEVEVEILEKDSLIANLTKNKIRFSLFYYPYKLLSPLNRYEIKSGLTCSLASIDDLEAMKAVALVQRGSAKDFVDLYFLLSYTKHSFQELSRLVKEKYLLDEKYDYHLKTALVYFDDAERELEGIWLVAEDGKAKKISEKEWKEIKDFFFRFIQ